MQYAREAGKISELAVESWALTKDFSSGRAVDGVSLAVQKGSIYALLGPSGAGKSTLLKLLIGLMAPSSGGGLCLGLDILTKGLRIREVTAYLPRNHRYYDYMTINGLLSFCRGFYPQWDDRITWRILARFELYGNTKIHRLSREQRQLLGLALSLPSLPGLLLLEEPVSGLASASRDLYYQVLLEETRFQGTTVILTAQHPAEVAGAVDQVALLKEGRLLEIVRGRELHKLSNFIKEEETHDSSHPLP